jgi:hypothetical protein
LHYQFHALYGIPVTSSVKLTPLVIFRGGKNVETQFEAAAQIKYQEKIWASLLHRGKSVYGAGFGANVGKAILFNYNFSFFSDVTLNAYQHHEFTVGLKLSEFFPKREDKVEMVK